MTTNLLPTVSEAAQRLRPPLTVTASASAETGSFDDAFVEMRDGRVLWRIVRERSVLGLVVAPEFDRCVWYDADLVKRLFGSGGMARGEAGRESAEAPRELMTRSLQDLIEDLEQLRPSVAVAFEESTWKATREQLNDLGRRRDAELFGRPGLDIFRDDYDPRHLFCEIQRLKHQKKIPQ